MIIFIDGHDIAGIKIGWLAKFESPLVFEIQPRYSASEPGDWLKIIDHEIANQNLSWDKIEGVAVVAGPGSPTALRTSLALVQTLTLVSKKDLYQVAIEEGECLTGKKIETGFILPIYNRPVNISVSNKDSLRRPL